MKIILLGSPGTGKGTQANLISKKFNIPNICTSAILRNSFKRYSSSNIKNNIDNGILVKDNIVMSLIKERIKKKDCLKGFVLDGFPRNLSQAKLFEKLKININHIIELFLPKEKIISRLTTGRMIHKSSGRTYHIKFNPPIKEKIDDITGEKLSYRKDDNIKIINKRLKEYFSKFKEIKYFYMKKKINYLTINSEESPNNVNKKIIKKIFKKSYCLKK
ncbi:nucleoside monophosphate kinase [Buchnera aphidicola (Taiwanaphis decaspermi)]|uniref:adenylate kinase family protein n=1 Tax=Buchnera aphidicola TaxID=9 RepID=UPI0031B84CFB